ncbi:MAG TPA: NADH-quinone oxidoreductase subunit NuoH [Actinomycetota bacterium]|nr:NADH-quinone oxidoreductase subunit NuoH [Actinomycetota bacterium]
MIEFLGAVGQSFVDDIFGNFWLALIAKIILVMGFVLVAPIGVIYTELKIMAHMQHRLGPMYAGRFHGIGQPIADGIKLIQKEDVIPAAADSAVFTLAPAVVLVPYIALFVVIPFGASVFAENLDVGIFFALAITAVSVIGFLMAGWASANKFSLIGALRGAAQLIAYELPMILAAVAVVMQAGTLSLVGIVEAQQQYWYVFTQPLGLVIFLIAALAELNRTPFDMPIAESEIIFGAYTEYTGMKFGLLMLAEYAGILAFSGLGAVLFLGGYQQLPFLSWVPGVFMMLGKVGALAFLIIWLRVTYPRLREDQLQRFAWVVLIPLALLNILITAVVKVVI